eukprot:gb/GFBE01001772.1/.p1 GENE.gb/GFBE01001772.1/~~gb/GFBE01001772.1/.p1  ORF type:complete len:309 (+),score=74.28 gb/GFBE01001772.1/:1-927(+)
MARILGVAAVAAFMVTTLAEDGIPSCASTGVAYNDPQRNATPNAGQTPSADACQQSCQRTVFCERFTWYNDSQWCWLQGNEYTTFPSEHGVSGPVRCPGDTTTTAVIYIAPETAVTNLSPNGTSAAAGEPAAEKAAAAATGAAEPPADTFPAWGWAVVAAAVALIAIAFFAMFFLGGKEKKTKKSGKKSSKSSSRDVESAESQPLVQSVPTPVPVLAPAAYTSGGYTSGRVIVGGSPLPAPPMASYQMVNMAQPQYSYVSGGSVTAAPAMMAPPVASYVQQQPVDMFSQLDANNDGVLSPEEMAAMRR